MAEGKLLATVVESALIRSRVASRARPYPTIMNYPGLSAPSPLWTNYMEENHGSISASLQENFEAIKRDYINLASLDNDNTQEKKSDYIDEHNKLHNGEWNWNSYVQKGQVSGSFAATCPHTVKVLEGLSHTPNSLTPEKVNSLVKGMPFSYAFFSALGPKSEIAAHYGPTNLRIRCHLPLILPESGDCGLEIGGELVRWEVGKPLFFDDCFMHRVWNHSPNETRVILLFDIWHPELEREEVEAIKDMFTFLSKPQN